VVRESPLIFSEKAWRFVQASASASDDSLRIQINLNVSGCNGYQITLETLQEKPNGCLEIVHQGSYLYLDPAIYDRVKGTAVELSDLGFGQSKLIFCHPDATYVCGCGESFTLPEQEAPND
tara:strand:- start:194 stop:556 length:363 start_codon:yes stop_codon:yes gene_type:complete